MNVVKKYGEGAELVWNDRKRFMGMPLSLCILQLKKSTFTEFMTFLCINHLQEKFLTLEQLHFSVMTNVLQDLF